MAPGKLNKTIVRYSIVLMVLTFTVASYFIILEPIAETNAYFTDQDESNIVDLLQ
jgi:hypothetical protein